MRVVFLTFLLGSAAVASPVAISGYNITDAVLSGFGGWAHTYDGTITPGATFTHQTFDGQFGNYSGLGSGTLNDGVIGTWVGASELFLAAPGADDGTPADPMIYLSLASVNLLSTIEIYGGNFDNGIPGALSGVTVQLVGPGGTSAPVSFLTAPAGFTYPGNGRFAINEMIDLMGTGLENFAASGILLRNFTVSSPDEGWFSIAEIGITANDATAVPEPLSFLLAGPALAGILLARRRRTK